MHGMKEIIQEAATLPVEERVTIVDELLRTLNVPDPVIDREWVEAARARLADLRSGRARGVPADQVFMKVAQRSAR